MMKQKLILSMLAVVLTVIVATSEVVHANQPVAEGLDPEQVLTGTDLTNWNALTADNQAILRNEIIPEIPERVSDTTLRAGILAGLVTVMHNIQVKRDEREALGGEIALSANTVTCDHDVDVNAFGAVSMLSCEAEMAHISARARLAPIGGQAVGDNTENCWNCSFEWATVPYSITSGSWIGFGWAYPTGHQGGPYPQYSRYFGDDTYYAD